MIKMQWNRDTMSSQLLTIGDYLMNHYILICAPFSFFFILSRAIDV